MERVSSPKITGENIFVEKRRNLNEAPMLLPMTEGEFLRQRAIGKLTKELIKDVNEGGSLIEPDSALGPPRPRLRDPHASTVPNNLTTETGDDIPSSKRFLLGSKSIVICALLLLATGMSIGGEWTGTNGLLEYWKLNNLPSALEAIFAGSSTEKHSAQAAPAPDSSDLAHQLNPAPDSTDLAHQLNMIARDVLLIQRNIKELASAQAQIRTAQEQQLSDTQSQLAALRTQLTAKQKPQSAPPERRKFNRTDSHYTWR
jgi:hypothetical protein